MLKRIFCIILIGSSCNGWAIDCSGLKVVELQAQKANLLVKVKPASGEWAVWKNLGEHGSPHIAAFQSIAQQAMATDSWVMLRFSGEHVCNETDYIAKVAAVRIIAQ